MKPISVLVPYDSDPAFPSTVTSLAESPLVGEILVMSRQKAVNLTLPKGEFIVAGDTLWSGQTLNLAISRARASYLLVLTRPTMISFSTTGIGKMLKRAESTGAGVVYSDFFDEDEQGRRVLHPLNDYQSGSVRDDFDFGPAMLFSLGTIRDVLQKYGAIAAVRFAGLYDLRLKVSIDYPVHRIPDPLYSVRNAPGNPPRDQDLFAYVDPRNSQAQKEMEGVFTSYLKRIGAFLPADALKTAGPAGRTRPVVASVIIPVKNREGTIGDAVKSALSQVTDFPFNVIVIDNHSTDGTARVLADLATKHPSRMVHIIPARTDLGIGGCWNEGLHSHACGRFVVQLDSDDLYSSSRTLQSIVDMLREGSYAMVVGSYTLVNERLEEIPPGLVDHKEWTDENGHNNALRINGLGAPRAFDAAIMEQIDFLNVSYGEDYAAALRICREYKIGRIFESLYLCRRWMGNTDSGLSVEGANKNDAFKDSLRTEEIRARQEINRIS